MDYQQYIDCVGVPSCVMSVKDTGGGTWGEIRIVCANRQYRETMPGFVDGMLYYDLVPKDRKFEDFCYRAAILKKRMHAYVETKALGCWTDQQMIPLESVEEGIGYLQFMMEFTREADPDRMASVSVDTAEAVISACVKLMTARDFQENVHEVLQDLQNRADALGCRVLVIDHMKKEALTFSEVIRTDDPSYISAYTGIIPYEIVRTWEKAIGVSNNLIIQSEEDMDALAARAPEWVQSLRDYKIRSLVISPLRRAGEVLGYLYIANFDVSKAVEIKEIVELLSFFLASELSNHLLMDRLREMSQTDALTGLGNRTAMIHRMESIEDGSFGVVNIDLNGLKAVNDTQGHDAGDRMLNQAAEILRKIYYEQDIYRTGGDEFIILIDSIPEESFRRKKERLRMGLEKHQDISMAIGACWSDGTTDVATAFRRADEEMYEDKRSFYEQYPELQRR